MLIRQVHQGSVLFVTIGIFKVKGSKSESSVRNGFHDILIMSISFNNAVISNIHSADYN